MNKVTNEFSEFVLFSEDENTARNVSTTLRQQLLDFKLDFLRLSLVG
jgi:hypothetical protein